MVSIRCLLAMFQGILHMHILLSGSIVVPTTSVLSEQLVQFKRQLS